MGAFHAYDIRGIYNKDFNQEDVYRIGYFLPQLLSANKILVGRDARVSSPEIFAALVRGINDAGADVFDIGLATTPLVYYTTAKLGFKASVQITASHNPKEYNGLKISRENALPVGYDSGLKELEALVLGGNVEASTKRGSITPVKVKEEYLEFLKSKLEDLSSLKIAVDCSNGMAGLFVRQVLGEAPTYIYDDVDGTFPNHEPNPLDESNVADLKALVNHTKSDIGVIFDGDADRVMFVDEKGKFVSPDLIIALLGHYFLEGKPAGQKVLQDIRSSKAVGEYLRKNFGAEIHTWRVGRAYAALKLREIDGIYGGELAGHYYFKDFFYSDSGMLAAILTLNVVARLKSKGISFSEAIAGISSYHNSGEINFKIVQKQEAMDAIKKHFEETETVTAFYDFDGYRLEFADWWLNVRPSNTEPYLRFLAEATSDDLLAEKVRVVKGIISNFK
ncbi:phosphomannomutase/phosphoglucomutase [Acetobacteroides hydrogenigenes]|uniref:Phosphomannomutase n=1 Tax=Acetobacteroides hydrogenigenes TaxID=979970 RepID=A0A4R2E9N4_9BACT|nr:phosphomannomutase/phosphoglucomutase [Acetobacteroides hydrogenigenes]TCN65398.1 phosphomannomutase [Acetobacteroides hydrogenigenes]